MKKKITYGAALQASDVSLQRFDLLKGMCELIAEQEPERLGRLIDQTKERLDHYGQSCSGGEQYAAEDPGEAAYRSQPRLLTERSRYSFLDVLREELSNSSEAYFSTAFCSSAVINLLVRPLEALKHSGGELKVLTSCMNHVNDPGDLLHLQQLIGTGSVHIYDPDSDGTGLSDSMRPPPFHVKAYLFEHHDGTRGMIIGSSNLTVSGALKNIEWNYYSNTEITVPLEHAWQSMFDEAKLLFCRYWEQESFQVTEAFVHAYRDIWKEQQHRRVRQAASAASSGSADPVIEPRDGQLQPLESLKRLREQSVTRAAVIAATGLGKTYLSAFDAKYSGAKTILFIAHREQILIQAQQAYTAVFGSAMRCVLIAGGSSLEQKLADLERGDIIFGTIQSLSKEYLLTALALKRFDYVVIDEFHHAASKSYQRLIDQLDPGFLLGMTATPDRMDGRDILSICDYNIACDIRLFDAIDNHWLTPFQYYGIFDETDYSQIAWTGTGYDEASLASHLSHDTRVQLVLQNLRKYLPYAGKIKALAFCANIGHAQYMAQQLSACGMPSVCISGMDSQSERTRVLRDLADDANELSVICSVDVFNEGVDIPELSHILLLRPTQSSTVLLQQIGRGLRLVEGKEFVVVLDLIGNYRKNYLPAMVLSGTRELQELSTGCTAFRLPALCHADIDSRVVEIWREEISRTLRAADPRGFLRDCYLEQYRAAAREIGRPLQCMDLFMDEELREFSMKGCIAAFGSFLRFKDQVPDLDPYERQLLHTPGEAFLQHLERSLKPSRTYKMVVLLSLLALPVGTCSWTIEAIARQFLEFYLQHPIYQADYSALAGYGGNKRDFPLKAVRSHLIRMPLKFLSNGDHDCFVLDTAAKSFSLREQYVPYWQDAAFRALAADRVMYVLTSYKRQKLS
ncbi:MAG: DEAD/DEAH box helicase family protein [Spirochaetia bacterium]|nr:DEAD/DEAH box helicase family protein [Spirochaetia bacterium]